jgi:hypothetical protein
MSRKSNQFEENKFNPTNSEQFVDPSQTSESFEQNSAEVQKKIPFRNIAIGFGGVSAVTFAAGFGGMLMLRQPSPEVVAITCQTAKDWNKNQTNSLQSLAQRQEENATQAKKENKPVAEAKVLGTITALEFAQIQKEIASLDLTKDTSIPFFTSNFIKVLKVVDSENILDSQEQMRLLSFYHQSYRNVEWDKPTSESYVGFINAFNTKAEELRQVSFGALAEQNCANPAKVKIVDSKDSQTKDSQNYALVANAIKQESDFRPVKNVGLVKAIGVHNQLIEKINNENKGGKDFKQAPIFVFNDGRSQIRVNASRKDSNPSPSEQNARILLNLSNLVSPERNLSQDHLDRIAREIQFFMNDVDRNSKLNTPEQYQENLMGLVNRIVGIDQEIKQDIEKSKNGEKYLFWLQVTGVICGLGGIGSGLGHLKQHSNNKKQQTKIEVLETGVINNNSGDLAVIVLQDKLNQLRADNIADKAKFEQQLAEMGRFIIGKDKDGKYIFASKVELQTDSNKLAQYLNYFGKDNPGRLNETLDILSTLNPDTQATIRLLEYQDLNNVLGGMKDKFAKLEGQSQTQFEDNIREVLNFVYMLQEFAYNVTKETSSLNTNGIVKFDELKAMKLKIQNEYLPEIQKSLIGLVDQTQKGQSKLRFSRKSKILLNRIETILEEIPAIVAIEKIETPKTTLTPYIIKTIDSLVGKKGSDINPIKLSQLKDWYMAQNPNFDMEKYISVDYWSTKNISSIDAQELPNYDGHLKAIETDLNSFKTDCKIFFMQFKSQEISEKDITKEMLMEYYEQLFPKTRLEKKAEYFANCKTELQSIFRQLLEGGIISKAIGTYNPSIENKESQLKGTADKVIQIGTTLVDGTASTALKQAVESIKKNGIGETVAGIADTVATKLRLSKAKIEEQEASNALANEQISDAKAALEKLEYKIAGQETSFPQEIIQYNELVIQPMLKQLEYARAYMYDTQKVINNLVKLLQEVEQETDVSESGFLLEVIDEQLVTLENDSKFKEFTTNLVHINTEEKLQALNIKSLYKETEETAKSSVQKLAEKIISDTRKQIEVINKVYGEIAKLV